MEATVEPKDQKFELIPEGHERHETHVVVTGIHIPFWDMVTLLVKFVLALTPAAVILAVIALFVAIVVAAAIG